MIKSTLVKLTDSTKKAIEQVAQWHNVSSQAVIDKIYDNFKVDLFYYGLNVKVGRSVAGVKDDKEKAEIMASMVDALYNGSWDREKTINKEKLKKQAIQELLQVLPPELRQVVKEKAGI